MKPHKISTHSVYSDNCYFHFFLWVVWLSWNFVRFHIILFQTALKVSTFYLEKQKSFIPKKVFFKPCVNIKTKIFVYWLNFQGRFCWKLFSMCFLTRPYNSLLYIPQLCHCTKLTLLCCCALFDQWCIKSHLLTSILLCFFWQELSSTINSQKKSKNP